MRQNVSPPPTVRPAISKRLGSWWLSSDDASLYGREIGTTRSTPGHPLQPELDDTLGIADRADRRRQLAGHDDDVDAGLARAARGRPRPRASAAPGCMTIIIGRPIVPGRYRRAMLRSLPVAGAIGVALGSRRRRRRSRRPASSAAAPSRTLPAPALESGQHGRRAAERRRRRASRSSPRSSAAARRAPSRQTVPVAADGTFTAAGAVRQARTTMRYELRGTLTETPSGVATARFERTTTTRTRRCSALDVLWEARRPPAGDRRTGGAAARRAARRHDDPARRRRHAARHRPAPVGRRPPRQPRDLRRQAELLGRRARRRRSTSRATTCRSCPTAASATASRGIVKTDASILKYVERFGATLGSTGAHGLLLGRALRPPPRDRQARHALPVGRRALVGDHLTIGTWQSSTPARRRGGPGDPGALSFSSSCMSQPAYGLKRAVGSRARSRAASCRR